MPDKTTTIYLPVLSMISLSTHVLPVFQVIAATLTIIVGARQVAKGIREEGSFKLYLKSFFKKK